MKKLNLQSQQAIEAIAQATLLLHNGMPAAAALFLDTALRLVKKEIELFRQPAPEQPVAQTIH